METEEFLKRCTYIENGLHTLADDLYSVAEGDMIEGRDDVIRRSREKIRLYDEFFPLLDDEEKEEIEPFLTDYIDRLRKNIGRIEKEK